MTKFYDNAKRNSPVRQRETIDGIHETNINTLAARAERFATNCNRPYDSAPLKLRTQRRVYYDLLI